MDEGRNAGIQGFHGSVFPKEIMKLILAFLLILSVVSAIATAQPVQSYCGQQTLYFQHQNTPDIPGYEELINYPSGNPEVDENITIKDTDGPVLIDAYILPAGSLENVIWLLKGRRVFTTYHYVSSNVGTTRINFTAFQRFANGTEVVFYSQLTEDINALSTAEYTTYRVSQQDLKTSPTDRLGIKVYGQTTHSSPITLHFVYQGTSNASHFMSGNFYCAEPTIYSEVLPGEALPINPTIPLSAIAIATLIIYLKRRKE